MATEVMRFRTVPADPGWQCDSYECRKVYDTRELAECCESAHRADRRHDRLQELPGEIEEAKATVAELEAELKKLKEEVDGHS